MFDSLEEVRGRENRKQALKRVKANKGSPGVDGMTVNDLTDFLKQHWPAIREQLLSGAYKPRPVKRVEIPKPDGGVRKLGIPTVLDRFIQQAVMQVLQRKWDWTFSEHSYGFRPGRPAQQYIAAGCRWCVDLDLEKILRSGFARQTDGEDRREGGRQASLEADPGVSHGGCHGKRAGGSDGGGDSVGWTSFPIAQ
jgi:RNA-directed DNA polymerase